MRPRVKYHVIYMNRDRYAISTMCKFFEVSRSGYYDYVKRMDKPAFDNEIAEQIRVIQESADKTYGYRRMWKCLKQKNVHRDPKTILRIMKKYELLSEIRRKRKWKYMGQQLHRYENLLNRQFQADHPNRKWVTDISYIQTKQGTQYFILLSHPDDISTLLLLCGFQASNRFGQNRTQVTGCRLQSGGDKGIFHTAGCRTSAADQITEALHNDTAPSILLSRAMDSP